MLSFQNPIQGSSNTLMQPSCFLEASHPSCREFSDFCGPNIFTVTTTEITHRGTCQDVNHNKVIETNRENDKQEAWMLIELQKIRRQMELCESRMALKNILLADQGSSHHITVKINELKVGTCYYFA